MMPARAAQKSKGATARANAKGATRKAVRSSASRDYALWLNRSLILVGCVVVLFAAGRGYLALEAIPVERITVTGELKNTQTHAVQELVQPALVGGFLSADLGQIRQRLEQLPWVYSVNVRRRWPNALEIHVEEQFAIARWGESALINHQGQLFDSHSTVDTADLPLLHGPDETSETVMDSFQRLSELLRPAHLRVAQLHVNERGQHVAHLDNGVVVVLGSKDFGDRVQLFTAVYQLELAARVHDIERVDLRYKSGLAVAFNQPEQIAGL